MNGRGANVRLLLRIGSEFACVGPLGAAVRAASAQLGLESEAAAEVELSVVEAVNNSIEHAYRLSGDGVVEVLLEALAPGVRIEVRDRGHAMSCGVLERAGPLEFDAAHVPSLPEGGMGLFIVKQLMDEVHYETSGSLNVLTMVRLGSRAGRSR
ncbi:MAG TPA: ATP-binding protein [Polyangia bacterium]|jgi:serine/threonine-protein kinase RsbW|nr:ATP-binding protein [Polyangia bacterium]